MSIQLLSQAIAYRHVHCSVSRTRSVRLRVRHLRLRRQPCALSREYPEGIFCAECRNIAQITSITTHVRNPYRVSQALLARQLLERIRTPRKRGKKRLRRSNSIYSRPTTTPQYNGGC